MDSPSHSLFGEQPRKYSLKPEHELKKIEDSMRERLIEEQKNKQASLWSSPQSEPTFGLKNNQEWFSGVWEVPLDAAQRERIRCKFCDGNHFESNCGLRHKCPLDQELKEERCYVRCFCGTRVIDGKCPQNCGGIWGQAVVPRRKKN